MDSPLPPLYEDDEYVYVPEELFQLLPPELLESFEAQKRHGSDILQIADADIKKLIRLVKALPTTNSLTYIYHRLRTAKFEPTTEMYLEHEMLTTAFVVTYSRLFVEGNGGSGVARDRIPAHLRHIHDDILELRHERYAHNGGHATVGGGVSFVFKNHEIQVGLKITSGFWVGGRDEWEELVRFLNGHMYERLHKILGRLNKKTGYEWRVPIGPAPDWV